MSHPSRPGDRLPSRAPTPGRRELRRLVILVVAVATILLSSSALGFVSAARAQEPEPPPKRAVIVAGPVHSATSRYRDYAEAIARAAEAEGMEVKRVFHPNATPSRVKRLANGADFFAYAGHGNGWPSPFPPCRT